MADKTINIGKLTLGNSRSPRIIAPIVGQTDKEVTTQAQAILTSPADMIEWRLDYLGDISELNQFIKTAEMLKNLRGKTPLIATIRTKAEGGETDYTDEAYVEVYSALIQTELVDAIDVEFRRATTIWPKLTQLAKAHNIKLILSYHDFKKTDSSTELASLYKQMATLHPDVVKVAVMPQQREDVLAFMLATQQANDLIEPPIIAMAMGNLGKISRISGASFGSIASFGSVTASSAPGQIAVADLKSMIQLLE